MGSHAAMIQDAAATPANGWDQAERQALLDAISARQPFLDFLLHRVNADGSRQQFRVSGEPMFNRSCSFIGYRGVGVEVLADGHVHGIKRK